MMVSLHVILLIVLSCIHVSGLAAPEGSRIVELLHRLNSADDKFVRAYIHNLLHSYGFITFNESFGQAEAEQYNGRPGVNLIGLLEATSRNTQTDHVIIIGSHYETGHITVGTMKPRSGLVCLLEAARIISTAIQKGECELEDTLVFVILDQPQFHHHHHHVKVGAEAFIADWLYPYFNETHKDLTSDYAFGGVILLDSLVGYVEKNNSQSLPEKFTELFPETVMEINSGGRKGDFIAIFGTEKTVSLIDVVVDAWKSDAIDAERHKIKQFHFENDQYPLLEETIPESKFYMPFWDPKLHDIHAALPTVIITDTGSRRSCNRRECEFDDNALPLMVHATHALASTVVRAQCSSRNGAPKVDVLLHQFLFAVLIIIRFLISTS